MWTEKHKSKSRGKRLGRRLAIEAVGEVGRRGYVVADEVRDALDPGKAHGPVRRFRDMPPEKRAEMERLYGGRG